jgi:hypothetical protein
MMPTQEHRVHVQVQAFSNFPETNMQKKISVKVQQIITPTASIRGHTSEEKIFKTGTKAGTSRRRKALLSLDAWNCWE